MYLRWVSLKINVVVKNMFNCYEKTVVIVT
jgi:hypothetical protein